MDGTHDKKSHLVMEEEKKLDESHIEEGTSPAPAEKKPEADSSKDDKKDVISSEEHLRVLRQNEALIRDLAKARRKNREHRLSAVSQPAPADTTDDDDQDEDEEKVQQKKQVTTDALAPLKARYQTKAWNKFVVDFPDFAADKDIDGDKQEVLLSTIKQFSLDGDAFDTDDFYGVYKKAYAVVNADDILKKEKRSREAATRQKMDDADFVADSAIPSSERNIGEQAGITPFDRKLAKETGKSPDEVAKLRRQFEDSHVSGL